MYLLKKFSVKNSGKHEIALAFKSLIFTFLLSILSSAPTYHISIIKVALADGDGGTIDNGAYYSHVNADRVYFNRTFTLGRCKFKFGELWHIATVSNFDMDEKVSDCAHSYRVSWVGPDCEEEYGVWRWKAGPLAGINWYKGFGISGTSVHGRYNGWATPGTGVPGHYYPDDVPSKVYAFRLPGNRRRWRNADFQTEYAIVCEKVYYKCFAKGTSRYDDSDHKNITCTCKKGFYSPLCDSVVVPIGDYKHAFTAFCGVNRTWDETRRFLKHKGRDWSAPNNSELLEKGMKALVSDKSAWLPARYDVVANLWRWTADAGPLLNNTEVKLSGLPQGGQEKQGLGIDKGVFVAGSLDDLKDCVVWQEIQYLPDNVTTTTAP